MNALYLAVAIVAEVVATSVLSMTDGFTKIVPSIVSMLGYLAAFYFLSLALKSMPVGMAYAIWAGLGILLVSLVGIFCLKQTPDLPMILGMALIIIGVVVIKLFSKVSGV